MLEKTALAQRRSRSVAALDAKLETAMQKVLGQAQTLFRSAEQELFFLLGEAKASCL
jgi:hypothetical protein